VSILSFYFIFLAISSVFAPCVAAGSLNRGRYERRVFLKIWLVDFVILSAEARVVLSSGGRLGGTRLRATGCDQCV